MLNRAVGGAYGFTTDIGGYYDVRIEPHDEGALPALGQLAALTPFFRLHGSLIAGVHTPWSYDAETVRIYRALTRLHQRAEPLILRLWRSAVRTGVPPTRPLWLAAPGPSVRRARTRWLLGDDVLVAPVVERGARSRAVVFPGGCWRHGQTGQVVRGPAVRRIAAPLGRLPGSCAAAPGPSRPEADDGRRAALVVAVTVRQAAWPPPWRWRAPEPASRRPPAAAASRVTTLRPVVETAPVPTAGTPRMTRPSGCIRATHAQHDRRHGQAGRLGRHHDWPAASCSTWPVGGPTTSTCAPASPWTAAA